MIKYQMIIDNPNIKNNISQETYKRLYEMYSGKGYEIKPYKFTWLGNIKCDKKEASNDK